MAPPTSVHLDKKDTASPDAEPNASVSRPARRRRRRCKAANGTGSNDAAKPVAAVTLRFKRFNLLWIGELFQELVKLLAQPPGLKSADPPCPIEGFPCDENGRDIFLALKDGRTLALLLTKTLMFRGEEIRWPSDKGTVHPACVVAPPTTAKPPHMSAVMLLIG
ncbi:hypothetical protein IWW40_002816 [Coemansia sp. RSA 1250]|nr:hypothetical protein IWW40_002816 [Coemansia sp. RSA 1250]